MKQVCYYTVAVERCKQNPGLAKFGIALEWGSRGRWFESSHSDQKRGNCSVSSLFLYFEQRTSGLLLRRRSISIRRMEMPREAQHFPLVRIQSLGPKERKLFGFLSFLLQAEDRLAGPSQRHKRKNCRSKGSPQSWDCGDFLFQRVLWMLFPEKWWLSRKILNIGFPVAWNRATPPGICG